MTDIHSHVLYGVDDGAKTREESIAMLKAASDCGVHRIIATPHYRRKWKDRTAAKTAYLDLMPIAEDMGISLEFGCEFSVFEFERERVDEYRAEFCLGDTRRFLLELGSKSEFRDVEEIIYALQRGGMDVILAHPERVFQLQRDKSMWDQYDELGCYFQMSVDALALSIFDPRRRLASRMLRQDRYDYLASDAHSVNDYFTYGAQMEKHHLK
ncbi:MAG TPA: hypothetical protein P5116_03540 [Eubacteriales bacterium]|jgi:protein-tyrosine phosphatase|nr:phosphoesterase [Clostridia bacterium]HRV72939.1 hypothetical protein [Eubacteriales bacterium]